MAFPPEQMEGFCSGIYLSNLPLSFSPVTRKLDQLQMLKDISISLRTRYQVWLSFLCILVQILYWQGDVQNIWRLIWTNLSLFYQTTARCSNFLSLQKYEIVGLGWKQLETDSMRLKSSCKILIVANHLLTADRSHQSPSRLTVNEIRDLRYCKNAINNPPK